MTDFQYASLSKIRVGSCEFSSIEELIKTARTTEEAKELLGDVFIWWQELTVMFPDKEGGSAAFVECTNDKVTVGPPSNYYRYSFPTVKKALQFADFINKKWLAFEGDWKKFLTDELTRLEGEFDA